jgi:hypothetical protein
MRSLFRGLAGALLILGLSAVVAVGPTDLAAQDKKDPKKDPPAKKPEEKPKDKDKDEAREKSVGFGTSDGLSLNGYWYQGNGIEKQRPDAVMMFPAPGNKVNDAWISLAKALSEKNFSVLLFDWRGTGMNAAETAGSRIFEDKGKFWGETYNQKLLKGSQKTIEDKGLEFKSLRNKSEGAFRYTDFMLNDLLAARFYLDRQNDNGKCNTNRVWIVTEKDGGQLGLAFIASEFMRNTIYNPKTTGPLEYSQIKAAGKDYVGLTCLSYAGGNATGAAVFRNSINNLPAANQKEARDHLEHRLAMVMIFGKKEGHGASKSAFSSVGAGGSDDNLRTNFKYPREIDNSKMASSVGGISLIDPMDSFGAKADIVKVMVEVSKDRQNFGKDPTDREANKMLFVPRFPAENLGRR